jgi:hypothetical protein
MRFNSEGMTMNKTLGIAISAALVSMLAACGAKEPPAAEPAAPAAVEAPAPVVEPAPMAEPVVEPDADPATDPAAMPETAPVDGEDEISPHAGGDKVNKLTEDAEAGGDKVEQINQE